MTVGQFLLYTQSVKRIAQRYWDLPSAILLVIAQTIVCQRLFITGWTSGLEVAILLTMAGVTLGLALGASRFGRATVLFLALGYTVFLLPLIAGARLSDANGPQGLVDLVGRLGASFALFAGGQPVEDPILFVVFIAVSFWVISLASGYALTRSGDFLGAVLPGGIALFIIQMYDYYAAERVAFLAVYFFLCLLLLGRLTYVRRRLFWKEQRIWFSSESSTDLNLSVIVTTVLLVLAIWLAPASTRSIAAAKNLWDEITQPWQQMRSDLGNAIAGLQGNRSGSLTDMYGSDLALGQQAAGGTDLLFSVQLPVTQSVPRYYWRVRTYDQYLNDEWHTTSTYDENFSPARPLDVTDTLGLPIGEFVFQSPRQGITTLVTPARPVWMSLPAVVTYVPVQGQEIEPVFFDANPPVRPGQEYRVHAAGANPTIVQLRGAGTAYPAWVTNLYLQLPADLPKDIADLAAQVTAGAATPYDKADAVTSYLRDNIRYTKTVPAPPPGQDMLEWFLFTYKAGYCNYYASAEVVMLRSLGIPARLAVGYAEGEFQPPDKRLVRLDDTHAWPEVYFPGIGWVEFEPTVSQDPLERPSGIVLPGTNPASLTPQPGVSVPPPRRGETSSPGASGPVSGVFSNSLLRLFLIFAALLVVVITAWLALFLTPDTAISRQVQRVFLQPVPSFIIAAMERITQDHPRWLDRWAERTSRSPVERSFRVVYDALRWLGSGARPAQTPAEAAGALSARLPQAAEDIRILLGEYQATLYGPTPGDGAAARRVAASIRRKTIRAAIRERLSFVLHLFRKT